MVSPWNYHRASGCRDLLPPTMETMVGWTAAIANVPMAVMISASSRPGRWPRYCSSPSSHYITGNSGCSLHPLKTRLFNAPFCSSFVLLLHLAVLVPKGIYVFAS